MVMIPNAASAAVAKRYVTLRPTTASGGTVGSAKVHVGDTVHSYNGRNSYEVRSVSGTTITVWVYLDNNGSFYFPKASDLWNNVSSVDYVIWTGNSSGKKTENGSGLTSNGAANSNCGEAVYYLKAGGGESGGDTDTALWNFTLKYDANGGSGAPDTQKYSTNNKYTKSHTFTIPSKTPTREGYTFLGWADSKDATSASRHPGGTCLVSQTVSGYNGGSVTKTLYAVWEKDAPPATKYTVTYTDGVDGEDIFLDQVYSDLLSGTKTPDFNGTPTRDGYVFKGWDSKVADTVTGDAVYTAQWEKATPNPSQTPSSTTKPTKPGSSISGSNGGNSSTSSSPKTGDSSDMMLWIGLLAFSGLGLAGVLVYFRKKTN